MDACHSTQLAQPHSIRCCSFHASSITAPVHVLSPSDCKGLLYDLPAIRGSLLPSPRVTFDTGQVPQLLTNVTGRFAKQWWNCQSPHYSTCNLAMIDQAEITARSVSNLFSLYFVYLYKYLFISRFGFKSGICLLIAPVPVHCFSITFR